ERTYCAGVRTNERWLALILRTDAFLAVGHSISFLETHGQELKNRDEPSTDTERRATVFAALAIHRRADESPNTCVSSPWAAVDGFSPNLPAVVQLPLHWRSHTRNADIEHGPLGRSTVRVDSVPIAVAQVECTDEAITATLDGVRDRARVFEYE